MKGESLLKVKAILEELQAKVHCGMDNLELEISGGYCSDLLSDVMANARQGNLWITLQTHQNVVAVASLVGLSGIIITRGLTPDQETLAKAGQENILILSTPLPSFTVAGKLYQLLGLK